RLLTHYFDKRASAISPRGTNSGSVADAKQPIPSFRVPTDVDNNENAQSHSPRAVIITPPPRAETVMARSWPGPNPTSSGLIALPKSDLPLAKLIQSYKTENERLEKTIQDLSKENKHLRE